MKQPWITPDDVRNYSCLADVKNRSNLQMGVDIRRAERYIMEYTNHDFSDGKYAGGIPEEVLDADVILSEYFAHNSAANGTAKKSESFDDYSYTAEDSFIDMKSLGLDVLLKPYRAVKTAGTATMRLRKL